MIGLSPVNFDFFNEKVGGVTAKEGSYCERGDLLRLFSKVIRKNGSSKFRMLAAWGDLRRWGDLRILHVISLSWVGLAAPF